MLSLCGALVTAIRDADETSSRPPFLMKTERKSSLRDVPKVK
jgi:hypothetical protein